MPSPRSISGSLSNSNSGSDRVHCPARAKDLKLQLNHTLSEISQVATAAQERTAHTASSPFPLHGAGTPPLSVPGQLPLVRAASDQHWPQRESVLVTPPMEKRRQARLRLQLEAQAEVVRAVDVFATGLADLREEIQQTRADNIEVQERLLANLLRLEHAMEAEGSRNCMAAAAIKQASEHMAEMACVLQDVVATPCRRHEKVWCPRYKSYDGHDGHRRELPEVQVALKIYHIGCVDTALMTFETDFTCHLDWRDPNLATFTAEELKDLDWTRFFNPVLSIDNGKGDAAWLEGADTVPRLYCNSPVESSSFPVTPPGVCDSEAAIKGPWLRKTMRFRGCLTLSVANLRCFPFDVLVLPIRLKAVRCRNVTLGNTLDGTSHRDRVHLIDDGRMTRDEEYCEAEARLRGKGHHITRAADRAMLEFDICGVSGGCPSDETRTDMYEVKIVVRRPLLSNHCWDVITMNLLVWLAATSFWDSSAPDLSSRLGITLTVVLTLAAFTSSRPAAIQKAPYVTFHDWCEQVSMLLVILIAVQNVVAVTLCGGEHEEAPSFMVETFQQNGATCEFSWCMSRGIDCQAIVVLLVAWTLLLVYSVVWVIVARRKAVQGAYLELQAVSHRCLIDHQRFGEEDSAPWSALLRSVLKPSRLVAVLKQWMTTSEVSSEAVPRESHARPPRQEEQSGNVNGGAVQLSGAHPPPLDEIHSDAGSSSTPPGTIPTPIDRRSPCSKDGQSLWAVTPQSTPSGSAFTSSTALRQVHSEERPAEAERGDRVISVRSKTQRASTTSSTEVRDVLEKTMRNEDHMEELLGHQAMTLSEAGKRATRNARHRMRSRSPVSVGLASPVRGFAQQPHPGSLAMGLTYQPFSDR
mmetsp:Transcript_27021/g.62420  ORF Transcript_27021/g.62420 Transcript_27021/m.62420 type:complete len:865 (-) Transcript_27021:45-2639(-)